MKKESSPKNKFLIVYGGFDSETGTNVVEVYMSELRKKLKQQEYDHTIKTIRGVGYLFSHE